MCKIIITLITALLVSSPALANTCVIVVPTDQVRGHASPRIVRIHEEAHCKGWDHHNGEIVPPAKWQRMPMPKGMTLEVMSVPTDVAKLVCNAIGRTHLDTYGCQFFEE